MVMLEQLLNTGNCICGLWDAVWFHLQSMFLTEFVGIFSLSLDTVETGISGNILSKLHVSFFKSWRRSLNSELVRSSICNVESTSTVDHVLFCCLLSVEACNKSEWVSDILRLMDSPVYPD